MQGLDFFGGVPVAAEDMGPVLQWEGTQEADRIVVLSDLWLDKPETLDRLEVVLEGDTWAQLKADQGHWIVPLWNAAAYGISFVLCMR